MSDVTCLPIRCELIYIILGYLRYKTINVSSEAQIKNSFRSQDIQVFAFLTIPWFTESVT